MAQNGEDEAEYRSANDSQGQAWKKVPGQVHNRVREIIEVMTEHGG
jgi:hypothetical protein